MNQPETLDILREFRQVIKQYEAETGESKYFFSYLMKYALNKFTKCLRVIMSEPSNLHVHTISFYGTEEDPLMDFPFNFNFIYDLNNQSTANDITTAVDKWLNDMPAGKTANWVVC